MQSEEQIYRAHDMLRAIVLGEIIGKPENLMVIHAALDVLCWVLGHDHNTAFQENLENLDKFMRELGYVLKRDDGTANGVPVS